MIDIRTALAFHRFGLGARPGGMEAHKGDVLKALMAEAGQALEPQPPAGSPFADLLASTELLERFMDFRGERRAVQQQAGNQAAAQTGIALPKALEPPALPPAKPGPGAVTPPPPKASAVPADPAAMSMTLPVNPVPVFVQDELAARLQSAITQQFGFRERLALFWANHFTVANVNPRVHIVCGAFEREVVRPHLAGRFEDMLQAASSHPAMLMYLDNAQSIGPTSPAGRNRTRGLNENLAREILELHTLGVAGGYSQADVTRFAEVLTGWTVVGAQANGGPPGTFIFRPQFHEPGPRRVVGRDYPQAGQDQGRAVLTDLARHPSTARHIATKLARHFVADAPPPAMVARMAAAFTAADGRLPAVYDAMLSSPEAWEPAPRKLRQPYEYAVALYRALQIPLLPAPGAAAAPELQFVTRALNLMGQPTFGAPSPKGWPEEMAAWIAPDAIKTRLDMAEIAARRVMKLQPVELAQSVLGPLLTEETRNAIRRAESQHQAMALMLMSPEFQRR